MKKEFNHWKENDLRRHRPWYDKHAEIILTVLIFAFSALIAFIF
jgi:hypothetical protein